MEDNKNQTVEKDDGIVKPAHVRPQGSSTPTGKTDLNDIKRRNAEEKKQDRKSSYAVVGIIALVTMVVIVLVYFFS